jgi:hypothetical protein
MMSVSPSGQIDVLRFRDPDGIVLELKGRA